MTQVLNPEPLLRALHEAGVRHVIIGGFAVNAHGVIRPSKDLDIVPDPDPRGAVQAVRAGGVIEEDRASARRLVPTQAAVHGFEPALRQSPRRIDAMLVARDDPDRLHF